MRALDGGNGRFGDIDLWVQIMLKTFQHTGADKEVLVTQTFEAQLGRHQHEKQPAQARRRCPEKLAILEGKEAITITNYD